MAHPPIVIYSPRHDPVGLAFMCKELGCDVSIVGNPNYWSELRLQGPKRLLRPRAQLVVRFDAGLCDAPEWPLHVAGLVGYVGQFPDAPSKALVLQYLSRCRFALSMADAGLDLESDQRAAWVYAICAHLDGVLFTPESLFDRTGKILLAGDGAYDSDVTLPKLPPEQHDDDNDVADDPCEPPMAARVAARAMILAAVVERGMIENEYISASDAEQARADLLDWLNAIDVIAEAEPSELALLKRQFGELEHQQMVDAIWRIEGLAVLLWALGLMDLPPYDELVDPQTVWNAVQVYDADLALDILQDAQLRRSEELASYRTQVTMTNWRFRNQRLHPGHADFVAMSRGCWIGTFDLTGFQILDSDLAVGGAPIRSIDPERLATCESIANERHQASNWLTGWNSSLYSQTDTST